MVYFHNRIERYPEAVQTLIAGAEPAGLGPGRPNRVVEPKLRALQPADIFDASHVVNPEMAQACIAGLWLLHNYLDESHRISQEIESQTGSFWHAIMHRREGDFSNAKYWFRCVGKHPIYPDLTAEAQGLLAEYSQAEFSKVVQCDAWNSAAFVDLCEKAVSARQDLAVQCGQLQQLEWDLLFDYCFRCATGG